MCPPTFAEDADNLTRLRKQIEVDMREAKANPEKSYAVVTDCEEAVVVIDRMTTMLPAIRNVLIQRRNAASAKIRSHQALERMEMLARTSRQKSRY